ncbi:MAG TPA: sensor histidine kinase, partial [Chloroflexi bacterium]|nr:sensor histidine kinase [Chloroflexota bacterium]
LAFTQLTRREQQARLELAEAHEQLREYAARVEELAMTRERNRLAREIHDGLGHYLTAINVQIRAAQARLDQDPELSREALSKAQQMTQEALADVRSSISALRADPTSSRPLEETIRLLLADVRATGLQTRLTVNGEPRSLPQEVEFACFRMVQEGLTNVCKHAQAKRVDLHLEFLEDSVRIRLQDDGKGADSPAGGFGLLGLRERCEMLGGSLNIATRPGEGFMLTMEVPG